MGVDYKGERMQLFVTKNNEKKKCEKDSFERKRYMQSNIDSDLKVIWKMKQKVQRKHHCIQLFEKIFFKTYLILYYKQ